MTTWFTPFWIAFYLTPVIYRLSRVNMSGGYSTPGTATWVYAGTKTSVRDATTREIWEHKHPGKSWDTMQQVTAGGCFVVLLLGLVLGLAVLAYEFFPLPEGGPERMSWQVGSTLAGVAAGAAYWALLLSLLWNIRSRLLAVLRGFALAAGPLLVGAFVVLPLLKIEFEIPFSSNWIWLSPALVAVIGLVDRTISKGKTGQAVRGGDRLGGWAMDMFIEMLQLDKGPPITSIRNAMRTLSSLIQRGDMDKHIRDRRLFKRSERILLDLIAGRRMTLSDGDIYDAREEIVQAVQAFYFRGIRIHAYDIHPRIKGALKR